ESASGIRRPASTPDSTTWDPGRLTDPPELPLRADLAWPDLCAPGGWALGPQLREAVLIHEIGVTISDGDWFVQQVFPRTPLTLDQCLWVSRARACSAAPCPPCPGPREGRSAAASPSTPLGPGPAFTPLDAFSAPHTPVVLYPEGCQQSTLQTKFSPSCSLLSPLASPSPCLPPLPPPSWPGNWLREAAVLRTSGPFTCTRFGIPLFKGRGRSVLTHGPQSASDLTYWRARPAPPLPCFPTTLTQGGFGERAGGSPRVSLPLLPRRRILVLRAGSGPCAHLQR
uniref:Uncharacterized protein n=1 Tax=Mustela putorius furo TaxID=9669 RepID=M3YL71_MUSPF